MTARIVGPGRQAYTYTTAQGNFAPAIGYKLHTYESGTTTPKTTWSDSAETAVNTNPIVLDGRGEAMVFWRGTYSVELRSPTNALIWRVDGYEGGGGGGAADTEFTQAGTGAATQSVQTKLRQYVAANDYTGVDPTGVSDSTAGLKAVFDYVIPLGKPVELEGTYRITGPIQPYASARASGGLHIVVKGKTSITVDAGAAGFSDVLYFHTTAFNSASILGGELNINGNNKAGRGISIRHDDASGGDVLIEAKLKLSNFLETNAAATRENSALEIIGLYGSVQIDSPYVYLVNRTNPTLGACAGVAVGNCSGNVVLNDPYIESVLCGPGAVQDGDGIKIFGKNPTVATEEYIGTVTVNGGNFINCQGRSAKVRSTSATFIRPRVKRTSSVVAIPQCVEFDFQACVNASVINPAYEYYGTNGVAPFAGSSSMSCIAFQQTVTSVESVARAIGGTMISQVEFPRYGLVVVASGARASIAEFSGLKAIPTGSLTTTMVNRAFVEFDASLVSSKSAKTKIVVRDNEMPIDNRPLLGYLGLGVPTTITQFSNEVTGNTSTLNGTYGRTMRNISGSAIQNMGDFSVYNNSRFKTLGPYTHFNFTQIGVGSRFFTDLPTVVATNAPPWGSLGSALIEVVDSWDSGSLTAIRVTVNRGRKASERFYSYDAGNTWDSDVLPSFSAANIAAIGNSVNTDNKLTGLPIYDSTNGKVMIASGTAAGSAWYGPAGAGTGVFPV